MKCVRYRIRQGIGMNYPLCELRTKSEGEVVVGRCDL